MFNYKEQITETQALVLEKSVTVYQKGKEAYAVAKPYMVKAYRFLTSEAVTTKVSAALEMSHDIIEIVISVLLMLVKIALTEDKPQQQSPVVVEEPQIVATTPAVKPVLTKAQKKAMARQAVA